jgi:predicted acylesterase/phospholipase RssA/CRP-like cAMP-binding protein
VKPGDESASRELQRRRRFELVVHLLHLFKGLDAEVLEELVPELEWVSLRSGETLFRQGDTPDATFFLISGRLRVVAEESSGPRVLNEVGPGESVGEMALLTDDDRSATVYAVRDSQLARLDEVTFRRFVESHPAALKRITEFVVRRLRFQSGAGIPERARLATIAVVPAHPDTSTAAFAEGLTAALAQHGSASHLNRSRVDDALGRRGVAELPEDDPDAMRLVQWLNERETAYRFVVYEADASWSGWCERSIRQADHVLVVADAGGDPALGENELRMRQRGHTARAPEQSLVLLGKPGSSGPSDTARWLEQRDFARHYHVRDHVRGAEPGDLARLARVLTGNAVGLVLGGGGARGFAHLGVLRALAELGIPIDLVGGTSIGAIVAAQVAMGLDPSEIQEVARTQFASVFDPTLPVVSLLAGRRIGARLADAFGRVEIEDLAIPFFCVSTNLTQATERVHRRGLLAQAVRASISLPGILPPVASEGDLLVDGGLTNNLPIDVMGDAVAGGRVVAVDVSPEVDMHAGDEIGHEISGWRILWQRLNPFTHAAPPPYILNLLTRSSLIASIIAEREKHARAAASLYLKIPAGDVKLLAFDAIEEIADRGYEATRDTVATWWEGCSSTED